MDDGVELILGGWLPDDESGGRTGRPDLLLRVGDGYVPGDVKWHKTVRTAEVRAALRYSLPAAPGGRARGRRARRAGPPIASTTTSSSRTTGGCSRRAADGGR